MIVTVETKRIAAIKAEMNQNLIIKIIKVY